jgi:enamine deaminase RidA (YjgF/YER057c/UK114 family)
MIDYETVLRWLHTSGTPGLGENKKLPEDITGQSELAWEHILRLLREADMTVDLRVFSPRKWPTLATIDRREDGAPDVVAAQMWATRPTVNAAATSSRWKFPQ